MTDTAPTAVKRTLRRLPNSAYRVREYLTEKEVDRLIETASRTRKQWGKGCSGDPTGLQAWSAGYRALLSAMGTD